MTNKDKSRLAAAILRVADAGTCDDLTLRAIVASINAEFDFEKGLSSDATGVIDLSGRDYLREIGAKS